MYNPKSTKSVPKYNMEGNYGLTCDYKKGAWNKRLINNYIKKLKWYQFHKRIEVSMVEKCDVKNLVNDISKAILSWNSKGKGL